MSESANNTIDFSGNYYTNTDKLYTFYTSPKYVGYYEIGGKHGLRVSLVNKPTWFHRTMVKLCFGWEWFDGQAV
jgi:hypothetical protein